MRPGHPPEQTDQGQREEGDRQTSEGHHRQWQTDPLTRLPAGDRCDGHLPDFSPRFTIGAARWAGESVLYTGYTDISTNHHAPSASISARRERRLALALGLNLVIVVTQAVYGFIASSLGLIADAGHNLTDVAAILASLIAVRWARRLPTGQRSFGYHRATILAALGNAVSILVVSVWIVYEAITRLAHPEPVRGGVIVVVAAIAAVANLIATLAVRESHAAHDGEDDHASGHAPDHAHGHAHGHDLNMRSAMLHLIGDTAASVGVAIAGTIILVTDGAYWLDPAVSLALSLLIAVQAWKLLRAATDVLLESTPVGIDVDEVSAAIEAVGGVEQAHDLHVWSLSSEIRALSAHVVLSGHPTLEEAQVVGAAVKQTIGPRFAISHVTLELECESCSPEGPWCAIDTTAPASAGERHRDEDASRWRERTAAMDQHQPAPQTRLEG